MSDAIPESRLKVLTNSELNSEPKVRFSAGDNTYRYADPETSALYPLPCRSEPLAFVSDPLDNQKDRWRFDIALPPIPAGSIVIPSYTQLGASNYRTQFSLIKDAGIALLPPVPSSTEVPRTSTAVTATQLEGVSTHIDYWLVSKATQNLTLRLLLTGTRPSSRYLLNVSSRPQQLSLNLGPDSDNDLGTALGPAPSATDRLVGQPQPVRLLSQRLGPNAIRGGICSPTATAMAMAQLSPNTAHSWPNFVAACRDGATGMYGVWPLNLYHASRLGHLGAIETPTNREQVSKVLEAQLPLVTSIRYAKDALTGAPQPQTSGHLVMLHGMHNGKALVGDPAASCVAEVRREYPLEQFFEAWLGYRGACYLMLPKA